VAPERDNAPNSTAIIALTRNGARMARTLAESLDRESTLLIDRRFREEGDTGEIFDLPLRPVVEQAFAEFSSLVLFLSTGATIRLLAPLLESKQVDPAVVCVDDAGSFCVSLISGHVGGAADLFEKLPEMVGPEAVTHYFSSHPVNRQRIVDLKSLARRRGYRAGPLKPLKWPPDGTCP